MKPYKILSFVNAFGKTYDFQFLDKSTIIADKDRQVMIEINDPEKTTKHKNPRTVFDDLRWQGCTLQNNQELWREMESRLDTQQDFECIDTKITVPQGNRLVRVLFEPLNGSVYFVDIEHIHALNFYELYVGNRAVTGYAKGGRFCLTLTPFHMSDAVGTVIAALNERRKHVDELGHA